MPIDASRESDRPWSVIGSSTAVLRPSESRTSEALAIVRVHELGGAVPLERDQVDALARFEVVADGEAVRSRDLGRTARSCAD
jgi:hypothetical protein